LVHKIGFSDDAVNKMPVYKRLYYLKKYNDELKAQQEAIDKRGTYR